MKKKICNNCPKRGQCCKNFMLHPDRIDKKQPEWAYTDKDSKKTVINRLKKEDLPFVPIRISKHFWRIKCLKIGKDGKCTIYQDRPQLCRDFKIGKDILCYYYKKNVK